MDPKTKDLSQDATPRAIASTLAPPPLKNDCFALPPGVDWTPVKSALAALQAALHPVTEPIEDLQTPFAGQILAQDVVARRSNPPGPNTAVDGYGFAAKALVDSASQVLPLVEGRAAAGAPFKGSVPMGSAIRILTGALLPDGVDTVVLEEDCRTDAHHVAFSGPIKPGSNTRKAGEDVVEGAAILPAGRVLTAPDLALNAATGTAQVATCRTLRVGVFSTGDEIVPPSATASMGQTFDANRPMLLSLAKSWGYDPVDLGHVQDDRDALRQCLNDSAAKADVILSSGGASAGDEDHVSAILRQEGALQTWRVAMKPGRPLAMGMWHGVPFFGLPGNPVAAFVCALIFARPALSLLAGGGWKDPVGFTVPAAFSKRKKPGRREYLRARLDENGQAEVFSSEGSGRISGLSWADGLVELDDEGQEISPGDPVRYIPFTSFGL